MEIDPEGQSSPIQEMPGVFVGTASAHETQESVEGIAADGWRDEITVTLAPGESTEWKLVMEEARARNTS
jgi:hypothetical protein